MRVVFTLTVGGEPSLLIYNVCVILSRGRRAKGDDDSDYNDDDQQMLTDQQKEEEAMFKSVFSFYQQNRGGV